MKLTGFRAAIIIFALVASSASYLIARNGIDVGRAIVESRCSAGAFIVHTQHVSSVQADVHSDEAVTLSDVSGQTVGAEYTPVTLTGSNLIPNGNLEVRNSAVPKGWSSNAVGSNSSQFSNVTGFNSKYGARIDLTQYKNGTADWFGPLLTVTPGAYYQFQDYYRSNTTTRAVLMLKDNTGKSQYINLDAVPSSAGWTSYTQRFFVPANVATIMISHPLDRQGWLETDNYVLQRATAPAYSEAMVSLTFDDGWRSIHDNALPVMEQYNLVSTQYLVSGFLGQLKEYMTQSQVYDFVKAGHEVGSHSVDHPDLTQLSTPDLSRQLQLSHDGLSKCFQPVTDFAPPFGASSEKSLTAVKSLYQTSRSTEVGFNSPDTLNPYQLKVQNVRADTPAAQVKAWLDTAKANHVWLILVYHQVIANGGEYGRSPVDFQTDMLLLKNSGIKNLTMHDAYQQTQTQASSK